MQIRETRKGGDKDQDRAMSATIGPSFYTCATGQRSDRQVCSEVFFGVRKSGIGADTPVFHEGIAVAAGHPASFS